MASVESPEAKENALVSKVELRIAMADSDAKLEALLKTYLAPLLLKLGSNFLSVRNKVISICGHVSVRAASPSFQLPVLALLKQFKDQQSPLIRMYDLKYIQIGYSRLAFKERLDLVPFILKGISADSRASPVNGAVLFNLFLRSLIQFKLPERGTSEDAQLRSNLDVAEVDLQFLCKTMSDLMLLVNPNVKPNPGLSIDVQDFLTLNSAAETWNPFSGGMNLVETKVAAVRFLASGIFIDTERILPLLFASADSNSRFSEVAEEALKRALPQVSLEDPSLIGNLFDIYFGYQQRSPVRTPIKIKLLSLFSRSKVAAQSTDHIIRLINEVFGSPTNLESNSSTKGREDTRLKAAVFSFVTWISRIGTPSTLKAVSARTIPVFKDFIETQGWPTALPSSRSDDELGQRRSAYECLGMLAKSNPEALLLDQDIELVRFLFRSLGEDVSGENISVSIDEALAGALKPYSQSTTSSHEEALRPFFLSQMQLDVGMESPADSNAVIMRSTHYAVVRFSNLIFPFNDIQARWMNLKALTSNMNETVEEGKRGLDPYWYQKMNFQVTPADQEENLARNQLPDFFEYCGTILSKSTQYHESSLFFRAADGSLLPGFEQAVSFARMLLLSTGQTNQSMDENFQVNLERQVEADNNFRVAVRDAIKIALETPAKLEALLLYVDAAFSLLVQKSDHYDVSKTHEATEICALVGDIAVEHICTRIGELRDGIYSNDPLRRLTSAKVFGILSSNPTCPQSLRQPLIEEFVQKITTWSSAVGAEINKVSGAIVAVASFSGRWSMRAGRLVELLADGIFIDKLMKILESSRDKTLLNATFDALEQLGLFGAVEPGQITAEKFKALKQTLFDNALKGNEKAILALSRLGMMCEERFDDPTSLLSQIIEDMIKLHEIKQLDTQFTVGEGLACIAAGWRSSSLISALDIEVSDPKTKPRTETVKMILEKVVDGAKQSKPSLQKASILWLLCLIQSCGHIQYLQDQLRLLQKFFMRFLSHKDTLVMEAASRGLSLIYEKSDEEVKSGLVRDLFLTFTGNKSSHQGTVEEDSELFDPGVLPTGDGASIVSYRDIMSLATDVGDPSIVYKFMSLAADNAIWSSRAALSNFGLNKILMDSGTDEYLSQNPKLYVKLFRFRFDPNPNVQRSMTTIWNTLVKDTNKILDLYFDDLMRELLQSMLGREWRSRQASCDAVADLIQGRKYEQYGQFLDDLWTASFKVLDDIKDSVRGAAMGLCQVLISMLTRSVESGSSPTATTAMLGKVLPFLSAQLDAAAKDARIFALSTILELINKNASKLKEFIPSLIETLLELLSSTEPALINYLHMNASKYNLTGEEIDAQRLQSVSSSPVMYAIEKCLDNTDESMIKQVASSIEKTIKEIRHLPSQAGCGRAIISLVTRRGLIFQPYSDKFITILLNSIFEQIRASAQIHAVSLGYLARISSDKSILLLARKASTVYFGDVEIGTEDSARRLLAADMVSSISKIATDKFMSHASEFLPPVFLAKHDSDESVQEKFKAVWADNAGSTRAMALYQKEILELARQHMGSQRWNIKHGAALTVGELAAHCGSHTTEKDYVEIYPHLERALSRQIWGSEHGGRKKVREETVTYGIAASKVLDRQGEVFAALKQALINETYQAQKFYRPHAAGELARFLKETDVDMSKEVFQLVSDVLPHMKTSKVRVRWEDEEDDGSPYSSLLVLFLASVSLNDAGSASIATKGIEMLSAVADESPAVTMHSAMCEGLELLLAQMGKRRDWQKAVGEQERRHLLDRTFLLLDKVESGSEMMRQKRANLLKLMALQLDEGKDVELLSLVQLTRQKWASEERALSVLQILNSVGTRPV